MGGFLRVVNCASQAVAVTLESPRNIEDLPGSIGVLEAAGGTFPTAGTELKPGQFYHRLEGEPTRRIHKDGKMYVVATTDGGQREAVRVNVDHNKWWKVLVHSVMHVHDVHYSGEQELGRSGQQTLEEDTLIYISTNTAVVAGLASSRFLPS